MEGSQQAQHAIPLSELFQLNGSKNCSTLPPELLERCSETFIKMSCHFNAFCGEEWVVHIAREVSMLLWYFTKYWLLLSGWKTNILCVL